MVRSGHSMAAKFMTAVLVWQMLVHGLFGCCTHHAQGCVAANADELHPAPAADSAAAFTQSSDSHDEHSCPGDAPRCVFVSVSPSDLSSHHLVWITGAATAPLAQASLAPVNLQQIVVSPIPLESWSAGERCAQLQIWRI